MLAAVDHVHHRHRQPIRGRPAKIPKQRQPDTHRRRARNGKRNPEDRVRAEVRFVRRSVELDQLRVDVALCGRVLAFERRAEHLVDGAHGLLHAFAVVARLVPIARFNGFVRPGRRPRRHDRFLDHAEAGRNGNRHRRIAARVEHFACVDAFDQRPAGAAHRFKHAEFPYVSTSQRSSGCAPA